MTTHLVRKKLTGMSGSIPRFYTWCGLSNTDSNIPNGDVLSYTLKDTTCNDCESAVALRELKKLA